MPESGLMKNIIPGDGYIGENLSVEERRQNGYRLHGWSST